MRLRVFSTEWDDTIGQDLGEFFDDPESVLGYEISDGIERRQDRCFATQGRLIALLVEKGIISFDEALKVVDISERRMSNHELREVKDD